jgi:hypothetical protein
MEEFDTPSKIDLRYADFNVVFTICNCSLDKKYSFYYGLDRTSAKVFLDRLRNIEKLDWRKLSALGRKDGLSVEKSDSESFNMIDEQNTMPNKITERYYFHIRIEKDGKFRVFGYQRQHYFCITHIDYDGRIHHT